MVNKIHFQSDGKKNPGTCHFRAAIYLNACAYPLPHDKILDQTRSKLNAFADDK